MAERMFRNDMSQIFETTILDRNTHAIFRAITIPQHRLADQRVLHRHEGVLDQLGLEPIAEIQTIWSMVNGLAYILHAEQGEAAVPEELIQRANQHTLYMGPMYKVAEAFITESFVPFQESPIDLKSVAQLALRATGAGIGAYAGFVASNGKPIILITVPTGMILCGAAAGLAKALEEGLHRRLLRMIGLVSPEPTPIKKSVRKKASH